jgi:hypothetical protein
VKNIYILILATALISLEAKSQSYTDAVGLRMGACGGLTYRKIIDNELVGELQLSGYHHSMILTFLVEKRRPMLIHDHIPLTLFIGAGVHAGAGRAYYNDYRSYNGHYDHYDNYSFSPKAGIDGFAALEYELDRYPVAVSLECKPYLEFFDYGFPGLHIPALAFALRYIF